MTGHEIISLCRPLMLKLAGRAARVHGADRDDLFQDLCVDVLRHATTYDPAKGAPTTWVYLRLKGVLATRRRHANSARGRAERASLDANDPVHESPDHRADDPAEVVERREVWELLTAAVGSLPERERDILKARAEGQTLEAVGEVLGVTKERVRQLAARAHERLARKLQAVA